MSWRIFGFRELVVKTFRGFFLTLSLVGIRYGIFWSCTSMHCVSYLFAVMFKCIGNNKVLVQFEIFFFNFTQLETCFVLRRYLCPCIEFSDKKNLSYGIGIIGAWILHFHQELNSVPKQSASTYNS